MAYYPEEQLMEGEIILERAIPTYWSFALTIVLLGIIGGLLTYGITTAIAAIIVYFGVKSQQIALTNKRVLGKYGIISRVVVDIPLNKISSVSATQSIWGRIFDFGDVVINSVGSEKIVIPGISKAHLFRGKISEKISE